MPVPVSPKIDTSARLAGGGFVEPRHELGELLHAAGEAIDGERTMQRLVMRQRRGTGAVSALRLNAPHRLRGPLGDEVVGVAVLRRRRGASRQREMVEPFAEVVNADRGASRSPAARPSSAFEPGKTMTS